MVCQYLQKCNEYMLVLPQSAAARTWTKPAIEKLMAETGSYRTNFLHYGSSSVFICLSSGSTWCRCSLLTEIEKHFFLVSGFCLEKLKQAGWHLAFYFLFSRLACMSEQLLPKLQTLFLRQRGLL